MKRFVRACVLIELLARKHGEAVIDLLPHSTKYCKLVSPAYAASRLNHRYATQTRDAR